MTSACGFPNKKTLLGVVDFDAHMWIFLHFCPMLKVNCPILHKVGPHPSLSLSMNPPHFITPHQPTRRDTILDQQKTTSALETVFGQIHLLPLLCYLMYYLGNKKWFCYIEKKVEVFYSRNINLGQIYTLGRTKVNCYFTTVRFYHLFLQVNKTYRWRPRNWPVI